MMRVELVDRFETLETHRARWHRLAAESPTRTVFQTFEWLTSWWNAFGEAYELATVLVLDGDELVAAAPLVARTARAWGRTLRHVEFAGGMPTDYSDVLHRDPRSLQRVIDALATDVSWDILDLRQLPATSPTPPALVARFPGWRGMLFPYDVAPAYVFADGHDGSDILGKKSVRRHVTGLRRAGVVEVRHLTRAEAIEPELDAFFDQHVARWAATPGASHFLEVRYRTFYRLLTRQLAPRGWLLFTVVSLDGRPAAFHYGFVYEGRLVWYKPSFAIELARLSPGEVLIAELVKHCQSEHLDELDFSVGPEPFKERFATIARHTLRFRAARSTYLQGLEWLDRTVRERAKRVEVARRLHGTVRRVARQLREATAAHDGPQSQRRA